MIIHDLFVPLELEGVKLPLCKVAVYHILIPRGRVDDCNICLHNNGIPRITFANLVVFANDLDWPNPPNCQLIVEVNL